MTRRLIIAAVLLGILGGVVVALVVPREHTTETGPTTRRAVQRITLGAPATPPSGAVAIRPSGRIRQQTLADPAGGPPFVLRWFRGRRVVPKSLRRRGVDPIVGRGWCVELARRFRGRLGWIDSTQTFHAARELPGVQPIDCGSRLPDMRRQPLFKLLTLITDPANPTARMLSTVLYGIAGPAARSLTVEIPGRTLRADVTRQGAFAVILPTGTRAADVHLTFTYAEGDPLRADVDREPPVPPGFPRLPPVDPAARLIVDGLAPDPLGGVPYAVAAVQTKDGQWCAEGGGRLVDGRVGTIEGRLGAFHEFTASRIAFQCATRLTPERPLAFGYGGGSEDYDPEELGRIARRAQRGIFQIAGVAHADVDRIVIATPRDVRTIVPGPRAHAFQAVYDGEFPTGSITLTSIMRNGRRHVDRIEHAGL